MKKLAFLTFFCFFLLFEQYLDVPPDLAILYPGMTADEINAHTDSLVMEFYESSAKSVDALMNRVIKKRAPGAAVAVIQDGRLLYSKGYGLANLRSKEAIQPDTKFMLASVTKQFTAMAIMMLKEDGKLSCDDLITRYFAGTPRGWRTITIKQLLTHTSGLPDRFYLIGYAEGFLNEDILGRLIEHRYLNTIPGRRFKYSNSGYNLLAMIVEKVSGMRFRDFLKQRIFDPLEMNDTQVYDETKPELDNRAVAYKPTRRGYRPNDFLLWTTGSSGIFSTVEDLYKWDQALYTEKLVSSETLNEAFTPHVRSGRKEHYGYGWRITSKSSPSALYHTGTLGGSSNIIFRAHEENFTIIILSNASLKPRRWLVREIAEIYRPGLIRKLSF